uniref:Uncharacterized protein n=1 Tax=Anguilla anguilla TaxID=7936 RepID=A0A0E9WIG5_ANGAN
MLNNKIFFKILWPHFRLSDRLMFNDKKACIWKNDCK